MTAAEKMPAPTGPPAVPKATAPARPSLLRRGFLYLARSLDGVLLLLLGVVAWCRARARPSPGAGVGVVTNTMEVGGTQQQILAWVRAQAAAADNIRLYLLTPGGGLLHDVRATRLEVAVVETAADQWWGGKFFLAALPRTFYVLALARLFRRHRPYLVWSQLFLSNVVAAPAARLAAVPRVVIGERGFSHWKYRRAGGSWWFRSAERLSAHLSNCIIVNSRALAEDYATWLGHPRREIRVIYNGIDARAWRARPRGDGAAALAPAPCPVVLHVGRLVAEKAQDLLLRVSARLWREGHPHRLVIVGTGELEGELRRQAAHLGIEGTTWFAGETLAPEDFYQAADIFALTSCAEGLPNVLLEAAVFSLPVVTTDAGGSREVVVDGETGFVVPVGDEVALAAALQRLLVDPGLRRRMGEAGRRRVEEVFTVERLVGEVDEVFAQLGWRRGDAGVG